jgi:hypothetical protein
MLKILVYFLHKDAPQTQECSEESGEEGGMEFINV